MLGAHVLKTWSSTQPTVSLSSGEAEFYGVVEAAGLALGQQAVLNDLGYQVPVRVWTDSSAAMGICGRQGLGKLRHIATHTLWVQEKVRSKAIELRKVRGEVNPADLFTKHLSSRERVELLVKLFGCEYREGRANSAPQLRRKEDEGQENAVQVVGDDVGGDWETTGATAGSTAYDYDDADYDRLFPMHDPDVLPHEYPRNDFDAYFPIAVSPEVANDNDDLYAHDWNLEKPDSQVLIKRAKIAPPPPRPNRRRR